MSLQDTHTQEPTPTPAEVTPNETPSNERHSRRSLWIALGTTASVLVLAAAGVFGVNILRDGTKGPTKSDKDSSTTSPDKSGSSPNPNISSSKEVPAPNPTPLSTEKYTSYKTLIPAFFNEVNEWGNDGGTLANEKLWINPPQGVTRDEFIAKLVDTGDAAFGDALLDSNSLETNQNLSNYESELQQAHASTVLINFETTPDSSHEDKQAYYQLAKIQPNGISNVTETAKQITATVALESVDNSSQNRAAQLSGDTTVNGQTQTDIMTWTNIDNNWKLTDFEPQ